MSQTIALPRRPSLGATVRSVRERTGTTPGHLQMLSVLTAVAAAALWLAGGTTVLSARGTVDAIGQRTVPAIIDAQKIHEALADADRSAANAFLSGVEASGPRQEYQRDIETATHELERAAEHNGAGSRASQDLQAITAMVAEYTGLVETARANNRQGFPVGATYLRTASALMHRPGDGILARVDALDALNTRGLVRQDSSLWFPAGLLATFFAFALVLAAVLVYTQLFLRRRFRRRRNARLLVATALLVVVSAAMFLQAVTTYDRLGVAEQQAFARLHSLWQMRSLLDDANGNESLSLIARGNGAPFDNAFKAETKALVDRPLTDELVRDAAAGRLGFKGLLADQIRNAGFPGERAASLRTLRAYQQFLSVDAAVRAKAGAGDREGAVALALGFGPGQLGAVFAELHSALAETIAIVQRQFDAAIRGASPSLALDVGIGLGAVVMALLAASALRPRIAEYRA